MFAIHSTDDGRALPLEYMTAMAGFPVTIGGTLTCITGGKLQPCEEGGVPSYIAMAECGELSEDKIVPVVRIQKDVVFETETSIEELEVGEKLAITDTGKELKRGTADDTGVFEVTWVGENGEVRGRFVV